MKTSKDFFRDKINPHFPIVEGQVLRIFGMKVNGKPFNPCKFTNYKLKQGYPIKIISDAFDSLIKNREHVKNSWAYCNHIVNKNTPNYYGRKNENNHKKIIQDFKEFVDSSERIQELTAGIGNIWI